MRTTLLLPALALGLSATTTMGEPRQWSDDFTLAATYNSDSLYASCLGSVTKYTLLEPLRGDINNQRVWSGGGSLNFTCRSVETIVPEIARIDFAIIGWFGIGLGNCPGQPPINQTTEPFTSGDICIYGAMRFNPWQCQFPGPNAWDIRGPDGKAGVANVDDDGDGTTDEWDETPAARPTTVNGGYGNRNGTGFQAGLDAAPGVAGVDDDGNGIVDDVGETGWAGSDDGDDTQRQMRWICMKSNVVAGKLLYLNIDPGSTGDAFSLMESVDARNYALEWANEIVSFEYYQPEIKYNWAFCISGYTCFGAMMWHGSDMANPAETLGPRTNTLHTGPQDNIIALAFETYGGDSKPPTLPTPLHFKRQMKFLGNGNFDDTFWIVSGSPVRYYPSPSADLDKDKDVDGFDFLTFSNCYNGSNRAPLAACPNLGADLDRDGDVDGFDFLTFSNCYNGSNRKPLAACFPPNLTACP
jgi:hypothetical protein